MIFWLDSFCLLNFFQLNLLVYPASSDFICVHLCKSVAKNSSLFRVLFVLVRG